MLTSNKFKKLVILLTLNKFKKLATKLVCWETGCLCIFIFPHPTLSSLTLPWIITRFLNSFYTFSPAQCMVICDFAPPNPFFESIGIQFFNLLTCDLWDAMPCQRSFTLIPKEAEGFPSGDNHSKHVPLLTYLVWLQPIYYNSRFLFIHANTIKVLLVVKTDKKNINYQPH